MSPTALCVCLSLVLLMAGCASQPASTTSDTVSPPTTPLGFMVAGYQFLSSQQPDQALASFDQAIALCQGQYNTELRKVYASRSLAESTYYMSLAAAGDTDAMTVDTSCSDALYLKAYALIDLEQLDEAEILLKSALEMAPVNAHYLSELGHIYQSRGQWEKALGSFSAAEDSAQNYSPEQVRQEELSRAKRGVGYNLIELGRLDEAQAKFSECLEINPDDESARNELNYIEDIRIRMKNGE